MTAVYPSSQNVFIPDHDATNKLVVDYARDLKKFAVNRYAQVVPVKAVQGYWLRMTVEEAGRLVNANLDNFVWPDGNPAPEFNNETESHEFVLYSTRRYAFGFNLGKLTVEQASWDVKAQHGSIKARQAMTGRTQLAVNAVTTQGNHDTGHVLDVTGISGNTGNWAASTTSRQDIKRSLMTGMELILDDTLAAVSQDDLVLVINSNLAARLIQCQEIVDYIKGSPQALAQIRGELESSNGSKYGLPDRLYGFKLEIEETRKVTSRKGGTRAVSQIMPNTQAALVSRPGGLVGVEGSPSFSSITIFALAGEEMLVETKDDVDNKRVTGRVIDNYVVKLTAPSATILFTNCQSS